MIEDTPEPDLAPEPATTASSDRKVVPLVRPRPNPPPLPADDDDDDPGPRAA